MKMASSKKGVKCVIANRGEIARRILRTARQKGYEIAVISTKEDEQSLARKEADKVLEVTSFLDMEAIIRSAKEWGASLLHSGYGYLSENAEFARQVEGNAIRFVGPTPENMRLLGNKEEARKLAQSLGLPVLPGCLSDELRIAAPSKWKELLDAKGLKPPYLIKAAGGGGGRGMRAVESVEELASSVERASREALSAFADGRVFIERFLKSPRHIEAQIMGDGNGNVIFFGERECSLQRRHQKVIEETPSPAVNRELRLKLAEAATTLASSVKYRNAGTVEFLLDEDGSFYFLEVNTRLQVEHPVTELVYGVDLVDSQFELAEGRIPKFFSQAGCGLVPEPRGWAIEARVIAEDPYRAFAPSPGRIAVYREPLIDGVRVDSGVAEGGVVTTAFDSLLSKCIAWGEDRTKAVEKLREALENYVILGPTTNITFLHRLVSHPDFRSANFDTDWISRHTEDLGSPTLQDDVLRLLNNPSFLEHLAKKIDGYPESRLDENVERFSATGRVIPYPGILPQYSIEKKNPAEYLLATGSNQCGQKFDLFAVRNSNEEFLWHLQGEAGRARDPLAGRKAAMSGRSEGGEVRAPMAGKVMEIHIREGDKVEEGQLIFVVESMKMQLEVLSQLKGSVKEVKVKQGDVLNGPDILAFLEAAE
jgi:acetyl/propionyl-CoA carboxylase alpha subunit